MKTLLPFRQWILWIRESTPVHIAHMQISLSWSPIIRMGCINIAIIQWFLCKSLNKFEQRMYHLVIYSHLIRDFHQYPLSNTLQISEKSFIFNKWMGKTDILSCKTCFRTLCLRLLDALLPSSLYLILMIFMKV